MSRYIRVPPLRSLAPRAAIGFGLLAPLVTVLLVVDPGGFGTVLRDVPPQSMMLLGFLLALAFAGMQAGAAMRLREQARPVPVRARTSSHRLPH